MLVSARTLSGGDHATRTMLVTIVDATEEHKRNAARELLFGELRHRVKNLLGAAHAIARQASTEGLTAEEFRDAFLGRLTAMVEAHDVSFGSETGGGLTRLVERVLAPYTRPGSLSIEALDDIDLPPGTLVSVSLVLHELATNAAKYGALSVPEGRVTVRWSLDPQRGSLVIDWIESGGPPVAQPVRTGYGSRLIDSTISYNLGGTVEQRFNSDGLKATISLPISP